MSELGLLRGLLIFSMALGPLGTHRHFSGSLPRQCVRWGIVAYGVALGCAALGLVSSAPKLSIAWLLFCAGSFGVFLRARAAALRSPRGLAACVPFLFSNIAAVWLVSGANDLRLLGYGPHFSFYAALHGNVLGWIFLGALTILADREDARRGPYLPAVLVGFVSFLLVAVGIDQLRWLKPIGVMGLTVVLPLSQITFLLRVWSRSRAAFALGALSFAGLLTTMTLAWGNELAVRVLPDALGIRAIVSIHGVLNAVVVGPSFLLAVYLAEPPAIPRGSAALSTEHGPSR